MSDVVARLNAALAGRYVVRKQVGAGGMATVYLADDLKHDRTVALKVLKPELAAVVGAERFLAEIKVTAGLQHPNILPLFDSGEADSFLFYVMPFIDGESLRDRLDRERQLPVSEAVRITISVANALDHAHRRGVVHRDIKPANIMLQDGEPVVADFGIALAVGASQGRLTETGLSVGTPFYMSPEPATEQAPSLSPDGRWLLYQSDRLGEHNVFVRPFPGVDQGLVQVSLAGGTEPRWARSGTEIFYRDADGQMVSAQVDADTGFRVTARDVLFDASAYWSDPAAQQYDVAPDDQRFIMLERQPGSGSLVVIWNWLDGVKARLREEGRLR